MSSDKPSPDDSPGTGKQYPCPKCKRPLQRRDGRRGPFWGCTGFPDCQATLNDLDGRPSTEINEQYRCPNCTRPMLKAAKSRGEYWFCSGYVKGCKVTLNDIEGVPQLAFPCRECGNVLVLREGKHGKFWGCRGYPECKASFRDKDNRPEF